MAGTQHFVNLHVQISWQAQHFVNLHVQISWQAQHFVNLHSGQAGMSPRRGRTRGRRPLAATRQRGKVSCCTVTCKRTRLTSNCSCRQIACAKSVRDAPCVLISKGAFAVRFAMGEGRPAPLRLQEPAHGCQLRTQCHTSQGQRKPCSTLTLLREYTLLSQRQAKRYHVKHRVCGGTESTLTSGVLGNLWVYILE